MIVNNWIHIQEKNYVVKESIFNLEERADLPSQEQMQPKGLILMNFIT